MKKLIYKHTLENNNEIKAAVCWGPGQPLKMKKKTIDKIRKAGWLKFWFVMVATGGFPYECVLLCLGEDPEGFFLRS